ncbi:hypothetical protein [Acidocella aquatica]|uniref:hypothetical protein n=1 Tax=Acidocella aquatica TaxID=1922313 RepID=UPI0024E0BA10|nr:hypothetical protein [Acidocella aquatica]
MRYNGYSFVCTMIFCNAIKHAAIIALITGVWLNEQGMAYTIRRENMPDLCHGGDFLPCRMKSSLFAIREAGWIKQVAMAINLWLIEDGHCRCSRLNI